MRSNIDDAALSGTRQYGTRYASAELTLDGDYTVLATSPIKLMFDGGAIDRTIRLPEITPDGGQEYWIFNTGTTNSLNVVDADGIAVGTIIATTSRIYSSFSTGTWVDFGGGGSPVVPAALTKSDDTNITLTLGGTPATALLQAVSITAGWTGTLAVTRGGLGFGTTSQGDLIYGSAANTLSKLAKDINATRYLSNTGASNNPAWAQVDLTNGVTGDLPFANLTQGSARSVLGVTGNATADVASIQGTADQVLVVNGAGTALAFGTVATAGITDKAVTYAKIQDISATSRVLGRITAGAGVTEELTGSNIRTIAGLATTDSPQFTAIELGNASDTTLARVSAGVVSIEGVTILTTATGQPLDATLTALAAFNTNGLLTQTAADTFTGRTITGTANEITLTNGSGVAGNPTVSLPTALTFTGKTVTGGTFASPTITTSPTAAGATWTDLGTVTTAAINGGTINGSVIGGVTPAAGSFTTLTASTSLTITSANAAALAVGRQGATNPVLNIDASTATVVTGINLKGAASGGRMAVSVTSSAIDEGLSIDAKGAGTIRLGATSTGSIEFSRTAVPTASDGAALGTTALMWSDLFVASGAVLNFNNGDVTITHAANTLTFAGADTAVQFASPIDAQNSLALSGDITPTALAADVNDYAPTNFATNTILRLDGGAADRNITGLAGGSDGLVRVLINIGSTNALVLKDASASSSAANRFAVGADITLGVNRAAILLYDSTSSRWRCIGQYVATGGGSGTVTSVATGFGLTGGTITGSGTLQISHSAPPGGNTLAINLGLTITAGSSALTIALKDQGGNDPSATSPVLVPFRSSTGTTGTVTWLSVEAATSLVISSGSTLGVTSSKGFRLWVVGFNDASTFRLGVINCLSGTTIYPLSVQGIASSTAEGGAGAADSAQVFYTGSAVTSKAYTVLGYIEWNSSGLTAGTWTTTNLSLVQIFGPGIPLPNHTVQTVFASTTTQTDFTSTTMANSALAGTITASSAANLINITAKGAGFINKGGVICGLLLADNTTDLGAYDYLWVGAAATTGVEAHMGMELTYQSNSTSAKTYRVRGAVSTTTGSPTFSWPIVDFISANAWASMIIKELMT